MSSDRERLLATAQELARLGSWEYDLRSGATLWSREMVRILGLEPDAEPRGLRDLLRVIHPDHRERVRALLSAAAGEREDDVQGDVRIVRPDGSIRELHGRAVLVRDAAGAPERWIGLAQDVTDQRLTERELEAHYAVSQALRDWESSESGVVDLLGAMGGALAYPMGSLWIWDPGQEALVCRAFWSAEGIDPQNFEHVKRSMVFRPGEGKPGVAWQSGEPVITADAATDPIFQPRDWALLRGLRSGLAFPALARDGPVAVLSFYGFDHRIPSASLVRTLTSLGHELGSFLDKRRGELGPRPLTDREIQVLRLAAEGNSGPEIAKRLFVSASTVKTHFDNSYEKLGVSDRAAAVAQALRTGLIH
jgi:PAS domain S-box-containing protein